MGPPPKKSRTGLFVGLGCLGLFLFVALVGGSLLWFEEGKGIHVPDTEVTNVPVRPGVPFQVDFVWSGPSYAFNNVWLVIEDGQKAGGEFTVEVTVKCGSYGRDERKTVSIPGYDVKQLDDKGSSFGAWIYLIDEYKRGSSAPVQCSGTVTPLKGTWTKAHIAVTQRQRPSDFFAR